MSRPWTNQREVWWARRLLKQAFSKKLTKPHKRWLELVKYYDLLDWIRAKWLRIDKEIVPVSEKLRRDPWGFQRQGWSTPTEIGMNDGERRLFDISSASTSGVCVWTAEIETVIDIAIPRRRLSRLKTKVYYEVVSALSCLHSLACKA